MFTKINASMHIIAMNRVKYRKTSLLGNLIIFELSEEPTVRFDKLEYALGESVTIIAEIPEPAEELVIEIFTDLVVGRKYRLQREASGIFKGEFKLVEMRNLDTKLADNEIPVERGGDMTATLEYKGKREVIEALVAEITPEIVFDKDWYKPTDKALISIISPDSNKDPEKEETISVRVTSNSDKNGINVELKETDINTGFFETELTLSTESSEVEGRIEVSGDDMIRVEFSMDPFTISYKEVPVSEKPPLVEPVEKPLILKPLGKPGHIVVEGSTDRTFLNAVTEKLGNTTLQELGYRVWDISVPNQEQSVPGMTIHGDKIIVFRDIDQGLNLRQAIESYAGRIKNTINSDYKITNDEILVTNTNAVVKLVLVGIPADTDLKAVNIKSHSMEDYLLKLIAIDSHVQSYYALGLGELYDRTQSLQNVLQRSKMNHSKTLFTMLVAIVGDCYESAIREIVNLASKENVWLVSKDILKHLVIVEEDE